MRDPLLDPLRSPAIDKAIAHLECARELLRLAHAPKTLRRVRLAISSAKGAARHAINMDARRRRTIA